MQGGTNTAGTPAENCCLLIQVRTQRAAQSLRSSRYTCHSWDAALSLSDSLITSPRFTAVHWLSCHVDVSPMNGHRLSMRGTLNWDHSAVSTIVHDCEIAAHARYLPFGFAAPTQHRP